MCYQKETVVGKEPKHRSTGGGLDNVLNMGEKIRASWNKLDSMLPKPGPVLRPAPSRSISPLGPSIKKKYRSPTDTWSKRREMSKSPSYSRTSPEPYKSSDIPRSKSQNLVRELSRGRLHLKPILPPQTLELPIETAERIYREKCKDMCIQVIPEQMGRFVDFCNRNVRRRKFAMEECGLGVEAAKVVAEVLRFSLDFPYIYIGKNPLRDDGALTIVKALAKSNHIVHLGLNSADLSPDRSQELLSYIEPHQSIVSLDLSSSDGLYRNRLCAPGSLALTPLLQHNSILSVLNLAGTALGLEGGEALALGLGGNSALLWLDISCNCLSGRVWEPLGRAVSASKLQYLNLSENSLKSAGADNLGKMVGGQWGQCPLLSLFAARCDINAACAKGFFIGMGKNPGIRTLNLEQNHIGSESVIELFQFFVDNNCLKELNLTCCGLKADGILTVADGLAKNQSLTSLNLSQNLFEDIGATALADSLPRNSYLKHLDLSSNRIRQAGGIAICQSLASNYCLETVILKDNSIDDAGGRILAEISARSKTLMRVGLDFNPVSMQFVREIERNISGNRLKKLKNVTPVLKREIRTLRVPKTAFEDIDKDKEAKIREQAELEGQLETHREKLMHVQEEENSKFDLLRAELEEVKQTKLQKAIELREVQTLLKTESSKVAEEYAMLETAFFDLAAEVKRLERECKRTKENYALRRLQAQQRLDEAKAIREKEISFKQLAAYSLDTMKREIEGNYPQPVSVKTTKTARKGKTAPESKAGGKKEGGKKSGEEGQTLR